MPTAIVEAAGGRNVMDGLPASWTTASWEAVAAAEPDFIILLDYQTGSGADALRRFLESHPLMKLTPAVRHHRYLKLQYAELTPGPANIGAVESWRGRCTRRRLNELADPAVYAARAVGAVGIVRVNGLEPAVGQRRAVMAADDGGIGAFIGAPLRHAGHYCRATAGAQSLAGGLDRRRAGDDRRAAADHHAQ